MKKLYIVLFFLAALNMQAQQDPHYTQYMYNMAVVNPAYAGSKEDISVGLLYRAQWSGVPGHPKTATLFGHLPVGDNIGLGLSVINDRIGPVKETNATADFAYRIQLNGEHNLAFGLKAGASFRSIGLTDIELGDPNDPYFAENANKTTPMVGAGFFYYTDNYYFGVAVPNFLKTAHLDADNGLELGSETNHYFITGGYVFQLNKIVKLKPSFLLKSAFDAPLSYDLNLNAKFYERFEIGASYRVEDSFSGMVNFDITPSITVGYAYDAVRTSIQDFAPASHEVMFVFTLGSPDRVSRSPRYF